VIGVGSRVVTAERVPPAVLPTPEFHPAKRVHGVVVAAMRQEEFDLSTRTAPHELSSNNERIPAFTQGRTTSTGTLGPCDG
jgi:hypothetical protein